jgi:hypothetical protein
MVGLAHFMMLAPVLSSVPEIRGTGPHARGFRFLPDPVVYGRHWASQSTIISLRLRRDRMTSLRSVPIDETADQAGNGLMLGTRFASSEKVSEFDCRHRSAGRHVGFV